VFYGWTSLVSVALPQATTFQEAGDLYSSSQADYYRARTFRGCASLSFGSLPALTTPGRGLLMDLPSLKRLDLPSITMVAQEYLSGTRNIEEATVGFAPFHAGLLDNQTKLGCLALPGLMTTEDSDLSGWPKLERISLPNCVILTEGAFAGDTGLTVLELGSLTQLTGDRHFEGCIALAAVYLEALAKVDSSASRVFGGCAELAAIGLGPTPPDAFHPQVFTNMGANSQTMMVYLAPPGIAQTYDDSTLIQGDVADDGYWCGVPIGHIALRPTPNESPTLSATPLRTVSPEASVSRSSKASATVAAGSVSEGWLRNLGIGCGCLVGIIVMVIICYCVYVMACKSSVGGP
jgi:hypothetical protein